MCLTGVDYFSTLGYQPSIAYENAGLLAPLATIVLVLVTLLGALPIYAYVAGRSHAGQGSIGMLAGLVSGWGGKILVLVLLGFAATDFVITKTLSAADAARSPDPESALALRRHVGCREDRQAISVTSFLLVLLGASFLRGFREVIGLAVVIVGVYMFAEQRSSSAGRIVYIVEHPELFEQLVNQRLEAGDWHLESERPLTGTGLSHGRRDQSLDFSEARAGAFWFRDRSGSDAAGERQRKR